MQLANEPTVLRPLRMNENACRKDLVVEMNCSAIYTALPKTLKTAAVHVMMKREGPRQQIPEHCQQ